MVSLLGENFAYRLRLKLFESLLAKDVTFFDRSLTGDLVQRLTTDVGELKVI